MPRLLDGGLSRTIGRAMSGLFLDATLKRDALAAGSDAFDPGAVTTTEYTCKAIHEEWGTYHHAAGLVRQGERKVLILAHSLSVEPAPGDRIVIRDEVFTVCDSGSGQRAVTTDPAKAVWVCRAIGGGVEDEDDGDNLELREDGSTELREDGTYELREAA